MSEPTPIAVAAIERNKERIADLLETLADTCEELLQLMHIDKIHTILVDDTTGIPLYQISIQKVKDADPIGVISNERT